MKLLEILRGWIFWILDLLKGGKVRLYVKLLKKYNEESSEVEIKNHQSEQVEKLLEHAKNTVPFYSNQKSKLLTDWPVVSKQIIKKNQESFISNLFRKEDLIKMSTSGSTGVPFTSFQNIDKKKHVNAETIYYNGLVGYKVGRRIVHYRAVPKEVQKSFVSQLKENIILIDCTDINDPVIEKALKELERTTRNNPSMLMGYSSTFDSFARYFKRYGNQKAKKCRIYGIVGGSTMLYDDTREEMEKAFCCKCVSRYANMENGFLGQDGFENNTFLPNYAHYYVEILKSNADEEADFGEIGRIVVTDLYNYAQPMIRYDTGDVGAWKILEFNGKSRRVITSFGGRKLDMIFNSAGNPVSPHAITRAIAGVVGIQQYQFAQLGSSKYEIRIIREENINEDDVLNAIKHVMGENSEIRIVYVDEIPALASGKRRYIVNEML